MSTTWRPRISRSGKTTKSSRSRVSRFEAGAASPSNPQKHYLVLFFDNSTMDFGDQARARQAAAKFIDANGGPNRLMAIVNFGGALQIAQNFTDDTQRLKNVVNGSQVFQRSRPMRRTPTRRS